MHKIKTQMGAVKTLMAAAAMLGLLAISTAPALAAWESNNGTAKGTSQLKEGTGMVFEVSSESLEMKCPAVSDEWTLTQQEKLSVSSKFEKCNIEALGLKFPVTVSGCNLQLEQEKGAFTALTNLVTPCLFVIQIKPTCTVLVPSQGNHKLKSTELSDVGKNVEALSNLSSISLEYPEATSENPENRKTCRDFLGTNTGVGSSWRYTTIEHEVKAL
jgi:hypothetical protein